MLIKNRFLIFSAKLDCLLARLEQEIFRLRWLHEETIREKISYCLYFIKDLWELDNILCFKSLEAKLEIKGVHFHQQLTEASSGSRGSWHLEFGLLTGEKAPVGGRRGKVARFLFAHLLHAGLHVAPS